MRRLTILLVAAGFLAGLLIALASCSNDVYIAEDTPEAAESIESVEDMEAAAQKTLDLYMSSAATGDRSKLDAFVKANALEGELGGEIDSALQPAPVPRWIPGAPDPPYFDAELAPGVPLYRDGDVLTFSGSGTINGALFDLILINAYGHAGMVDRDMVDTGTGYTTGTPCVVSSCMPEGVRYQTYEELYMANETWALLRVADGGLSEGWGAEFTTRYNVDTTEYSFLHLSFRPVTKEDEYWWYCSKVPYRVWRDAGESSTGDPVLLEAENFYELADPEGLWIIERDSILYKIYSCWYYRLPRWLRRYARTPDEVLQQALDELVTPDELRMAETLVPLAVWGDLTPEILLNNL